MGKLAWVVAAMAVLGCDNNRNVAVSNSNPLGTVGGVVLDVNGEMPLANAVVSLQTAGTVMMAMTDPSGIYTIPKVPAGAFFINVSASGYESAYVPGDLTGAVGNFPVSNPQATMPTIELFKTDMTFSVALVDDRGAPVPGVTVTARPQVKYFAYEYPYGGGGAFPSLQPYGQYTVTATSDATGVATFMGLPTATALNLLGNSNQMYIDVPPITVMGSTTYQYLGESLQVNPTRVQPPAGTNTYTIQLVGPNTPISAVYSSIDYIVGKTGTVLPAFVNPVASLLPTDKPITITFNQAVDQKALRAQLLDETGASLGNMTQTFIAGNIVQLTPAAAFSAGKRYNLVLHADPLSLAGSAGTPLNITAPFFTAGPATVSATATLTTLPVMGIAAPAVGKIVMLTFSEAVGIGRGASSNILGCVGWYESIDLDNSGGTVSYQGEYSTSLQTCPGAPAPIGFDVTKINSFEPAPSALIPMTGFANKWWAQVDDTTVTGGCKGGIAVACSKPIAATMMHLIFSHLDSTQTFTRANGQPLGDLAIAIQ
jgi:Carboxypeptidase regulatory-like domain/Bacterial Ig-like domain